MGYIIDVSEEMEINIEPRTTYEEVMQNLWFLYSSLEYDIPLDRALGMNPVYIDKPMETAKAMAAADIYEKTEKYEPRAEIVNIDFVVDEEQGVLRPVVEVEISDGYDNEEYTG